jgi:hypothetical protein
MARIAVVTGLCLLMVVGLAQAEPRPMPGGDGPGPDAAERRTDYELRFMDAYAEYREGNWERAAVQLEQLLGEDPADPRIPSYLAECYLNLDQPERARRVMERAPRPAEPLVLEEPAAPAQELSPAPPPPEPKRSLQRKRGRDRKPLERRIGVTGGFGGNAFGWGFDAFRGEVVGPPLSFGVQAHWRPWWFLSAVAGWGLSRAVVQSWWTGLRAHPVPWLISPMVGIGAVGEFGNYDQRVLWGEQPVYPYVELGGMAIWPRGVTTELGFDIVVDPSREGGAWIWPFLRFGYTF